LPFAALVFAARFAPCAPRALDFDALDFDALDFAAFDFGVETVCLAWRFTVSCLMTAGFGSGDFLAAGFVTTALVAARADSLLFLVIARFTPEAGKILLARAALRALPLTVERAEAEPLALLLRRDPEAGLADFRGVTTDDFCVFLWRGIALHPR
jgi:hypothetical protein